MDNVLALQAMEGPTALYDSPQGSWSTVSFIHKV